MESDLETVINDWHESVNTSDLDRCARSVGNPIVVLGPKGAGPITPAGFVEWVERSGITLRPTSWHPVSDRLMVVQQDATWPDAPTPVHVATLFRVKEGKVTAALRLPNLHESLNLAYIYRELAATE